MEQRTPHTVVVVYLRQLAAGEWSLDEALAMWDISATPAELEQLDSVLADAQERDGIAYHVTAAADVPKVAVDEIVAALRRAE